MGYDYMSLMDYPSEVVKIQKTIFKDGESIPLNDLLPKNINKILTGSELLLAYELDKYARLLLGKKVDMPGITVLNRLKNQPHFSFVVNNGLEITDKYNIEDLISYQTLSLFLYTDVLDGVVYKKDGTNYICNFNIDIKSNKDLNKESKSAAYISFMAYIFVLAYMNIDFVLPRVHFGLSGTPVAEGEFVDLIILERYGNKILTDCIAINYSPGVQSTWEAYLHYHRQIGYMCQEYTRQDKFKHLKNSFEVGDVVLLYDKKITAKGKNVGILTDCHPAVIRGYDKDRVILEKYVNKETLITRSVNLQEREQQFDHIKDMYSEADYTRFPSFKKEFDLADIGVGLMSYTEEQFFVHLMDSEDKTVQYFEVYTKESGGLELKAYELDIYDTIYAVFEDRGVNYNKTSFITKYFTPRKKRPFYEKIKENNMLKK